MEAGENTVRVWVGRNVLQAQFLSELLKENEIECLYTEHNIVGFQAGIYEFSLWVATKDEARARTLLETAEEEMSAALDQEPPPDTES